MSKRYLIAIGSPECPLLGLEKLKYVASDVATVAELLGSEQQAYARVLADELPLGAPSGAIERHVEEWFLAPERVESDCVVIYFAGHGDSVTRFQQHCLLTSNTQDKKITTAVKTAELVEFIFAADRHPQNVLLILDVCYAGKGAGEAIAQFAGELKKDFPQGTGLWIIATSDRNSKAYDGAFVRAWRDLMTDKYGAWRPSSSLQYISPTQLAYTVNHILGDDGKQQLVPLGGGGPIEPQFIKNPWYAPQLDGATVDDVNHWDPKARGDDRPGPWSFFTGRKAVLEACLAWLRAPKIDRLARVVIGGPGSGKSAVLGQVVRRAEKKGAPPLRIHARGKQLKDVVAILAQGIDETATTTQDLITKLKSLRSPIGVVVDSLDEAPEPTQLVRDLLRPLVDCDKVRLIVGMRTRDDSEWLADARLDLDLDAPEFFDRHDLEQYAFAILTSTTDTPATYADATAHQAARKIARAIAKRAGKSFLYVRLAARGLAGKPAVDTALPNWEASLPVPDDMKTLFEYDLGRFDAATRRRFVDLLVPIAYARRRGLPQKHIWATVASRIADTRYTNDDIRELKERLGYYLIQDTEDRETVYRPFHQSLADYLRRRTQDDNVEPRFAAALAELAAEAGGWAEVREPYLLAAYPSHAKQAGKIDSAVADIGLLAAASPAGLLPELHRLTDGPAAQSARAYRQAFPRLVAGRPHENAPYLRLAAFKYDAPRLGEQLVDTFEAKSAWWPRWIKWSPTAAEWAVFETHGTITALCGSVDPEGNPLVVCGHADGSITIWRLDTRAQFLHFEPPKASMRVESLAVADHRGERLVVAVWRDGRISAFRQGSGRITGTWRPDSPFDSDRFPTNVVTLDHAGTPLAAFAFDTELLLFELPKLKLRTRRRKASGASIYSLATIRLKGKPILISGSDTMRHGEQSESHTLRQWTVPSLRCLRKGGDDVSLARDLLVFERDGESFFVTEEFTRTSVWRTADLRRESDPHDTMNHFFAARQSGDEIELFGESSGRIFRSQLVRPDSKKSKRRFALTDDPDDSGYDAPGEHWNAAALDDGRTVLLSADGNRIRVWDVGEFRSSAVSAGDLPSARDVECLSAWRETLFVGTRRGVVSSWNRRGEVLWSTVVSRRRIRSLAVGSDGNELFVGDDAGIIYRLNATDGSERTPPLSVGSRIVKLTVRPTSEGPVLFALVAVRRSSEVYFVRAWRLAGFEEIKTWESDVGPDDKAKVQSGEVAYPGEFQPVLAMGGYYRTKATYGLTVVEHQGLTLVALAGAHGEVRVMDLFQLTEVVAWIGGAPTYYVTSLAGGVVDRAPLIFGGDDRGVLFCNNALPGISNRRRVDQAHRRSIDVLDFRETPRGPVLLSGGRDGWIRFWTPDLAPLFEIEVGRGVSSLAWLGDDLVVGTDLGVVSLAIRWDAVFGRAAPRIEASSNR
jgi:WD40 repeat protein